MISESIKNKILDSLNSIEKNKNVRIFYACESGSRAWGFPSTDSDYDVRFLYIHPMEFQVLVDRVRESEKLKKEIDILLQRKKSGEELSWGPKNPVINDFISKELSRFESAKLVGGKRKLDNEKLNELFRNALSEVWD